MRSRWHRWLEEFGFLTDPTAWVGRTVERVEVGERWLFSGPTPIAIKFRDGSRAFIMAQSTGKGTSLHTERLRDLARDSRVFTPDEWAALETARREDEEAARREQEDRERRELARFREKYGEG